MPHAVKKHVFKNIKANIFSALKIDILPEISKNNILNVLTECRTHLRFFITSNSKRVSTSALFTKNYSSFWATNIVFMPS